MPTTKHNIDSDEVALTGVLDEFRTALREEIQAARTYEANNPVELRNGKRIAKIGNNFQYLFQIENALNLPGDTPGDLLVPDSPPLNVMVVSIDGLAITLSIPEDIGDFVPNARLRSNLTYLMIKLIERIENYANKANPVGERIRGEAPISGSEPAITLPDFFNQYQQKAIASSIGRDTTFIWGPPGTGKTQTIGEIGYLLYERNRSVLVVSHTNTAVDQAILRIGERIPPSELEKGKAIRIGDPKDERLRNYPDLLLDTHVARRSEVLSKNLDELKNQLETEKTESVKQSRLIDLCEWVDSSLSTIQKMVVALQEIRNDDNEVADLKERYFALIGKKAFWEEARNKANLINKQIERKGDLEHNIRRLSSEISDLEMTLAQKAEGIAEEKNLLNQTNSTGWLTRKWKGLPGPEEQETKIEQLEKTFGQLGIELDEKKEKYTTFKSVFRRMNHEIDVFRDQYGGMPQEIYREALKYNNTIQDLTKNINEKTELIKTSRIQLETQLKERLYVLIDAKLVERRPETAEAMLDEIISAHEKAKSKVEGHNLESLKEKQGEINKKIVSIESEIKEIEEQLQKIEEIIISEAEIVATTLTRAYLRESLQARRFDTVILDEASMAPIPALWIAAGLAQTNAVVVGDPKQLPPIVISEKESAKKWLGRDIFDEAGLKSYTTSEQHLGLAQK